RRQSGAAGSSRCVRGRRPRRAPSHDSAARRCAAEAASVGRESRREAERAELVASGSCEEDGGEAAALGARPWILQPLRFEQLKEALARRTFVPLAVTADDFEQGVCGHIAITRSHL